ncbi:hypothetical protein Vafri_8230 [Volvox africanus]|nr:hypothetical protein Vafri_8230 [Volvox africanus]
MLFSYCHVMRRFNREWVQDPGAAAAVLLSLTDVLAAVPTPTARRKPRSCSGPAAAVASSSSTVKAAVTAVAAAAAAGVTVSLPWLAKGDAEDGEAAARLPCTAAEACVHGMERACIPPVGTSKDRPYAVSICTTSPPCWATADPACCWLWRTRGG